MSLAGLTYQMSIRRMAVWYKGSLGDRWWFVHFVAAAKHWIWVGKISDIKSDIRSCIKSCKVEYFFKWHENL